MLWLHRNWISHTAALLLAIGVIAGGSSSQANAATIIANCVADPSALTAALAGAADGDIIEVQGTCRGNFLVQDNVTLRGPTATCDPAICVPDPTMPPGSGPATLDGQAAGTVLTIDAGKTVHVSHLQVTNGFSEVGGGGVWVNSGATVTLNTVRVFNSSLGRNGSGGGILNFGTLTVHNTTISGNRAGSNGGGAGIRNTFGTLTVTRSSIFGNTGGFSGAGIYSTGLLVVSGSIIADNTLGLDIASNGGGVYHDGAAGATIIDSMITGNTAHNGGGGIYSLENLTVRNARIVRNNAIFGSGGGVNRVNGSLTIENSTISDNRADAGGGIADSASSAFVSMTLRHVTISGNVATAFSPSGGGIFSLFGPTETAYNTIIAANVGQNCLFLFPGSSGGLTDGGYNVDDGSTCSFTAASNSLPNTNPLFDPLFSPQLTPGSPAVDAIPLGANGCGTALLTDLRGVARPQGPACDIGAFELVPPADTTPPLIVGMLDPLPNANGWNRSPVTVSWSVADAESGVASTAGCGTATLGTETAGTTLTCTATNGAGLSSLASVTVKLDQTAPTVLFSGNAGTYTVDQNIAIACAASDALSGLASSTCPNVTGAAYTFPLGPNTITATAVDRADNASSAAATFTVVVTPDSLCRLTERFVKNSAKYDARTPTQRQGIDKFTAAVCAKLTILGGDISPAQKQATITAYEHGVDALAASGWLTDAQRATLKALANAL